MYVMFALLYGTCARTERTEKFTTFLIPTIQVEKNSIISKNEIDQGTVNKLLEPIFGIKTDFMGFLKSKAATTVAMKTVAETANEKHLKPWSELCKVNRYFYCY